MARGDDDLPRGDPYLPPGCSQRDIDDPDPVEDWDEDDGDGDNDDDDNQDEDDEPMSNRVYIAGPMRGYDLFNFPAFDAARDKFIALGYEVESPADIDRLHGVDENFPPDQITPEMIREFARRDCEAIQRCTHIAMLTGWEKSTGATAEIALAKWLGLIVLDANTGEALNDSTNPKDRVGKLKPPIELIPPASIIFEALAMGNGAEKYDPYNWRSKKVQAMIYVGACLRHVLAWIDGEELADDSKVPHLGHAKACLGIIIDAQTSGNLIDNRPPAGAASKLIAMYTKSKTN